MTVKEAITILTAHNKWRRGGDGFMKEPGMIGQAIDVAVMELINQSHEITRLENEIDRLTQENLDTARREGAKSEPTEYGC